MKDQIRKWVLLSGSTIVIGSVLLLLTACRPDPVAWNVEITAKTNASILVDLVGINVLQKEEWARLPVDEYWKPDNPTRANANRVTLEVVQGNITLQEVKGAAADPGLTGSGTPTVVLSKSHPIWKQWMGRQAVGLVAIARFSGGSSAQPDPRKRVLPLHPDIWKAKGQTLQLEIQDGRLEILTPPSQKASKIPF